MSDIVYSLLSILFFGLGFVLLDAFCRALFEGGDA